MTLKAITVQLLALLALGIIQVANAGLIEDSKGSLELRNYYLNRDFRQSDAKQSKAEEWGQGFTTRIESGFTEGSIGVGLDAIAEQGLKLDSSPDRHGTGLLPFGPASNRPVDNYSELGLTAKMRVSKSILRLGTLQPMLPVATYNDTRLLPSTFQGGLLTSQQIDGLTFNGGHLNRTNLRDSSGRDEIGYGGASSDAFDFGGGSFALNPQLAVSYYYGKLDEIYRQQFVGVVHTLALPIGFSLKSDLRYFDSRGDGAERAGNINNRNLNGAFSLSKGGHRISTAFQRMSGHSNFPFLNGGDPYVVNLVTFNTFTRAEEDAWQLRYDYDFSALGLTGLTFMTRYVDARNAKNATGNDGEEWERDTDLAYVIQSGTFQGLSLRWRNLTFRSGNGLSTDLDENRLILGYTLALW